MSCRDLGVSKNWGHVFGDPHNKDYNTLGSILGFPIVWEATIWD